MKALLALLLAFAPLAATDIYDSIHQLPFNASGHFAAERALDQIFNEKEITTVIEIGSWAGASTRFFAFNVGEGGTVYAVDHWLGTPEHRGEQSDPLLPIIYQQFLSNTIYMGLHDRIVPVRMNSIEAASALNATADLIFIDAERNANGVYRDILLWINHLNEGGILCGAEYREREVGTGVHRAAQELGLTIETDRNGYFWRLK